MGGSAAILRSSALSRGAIPYVRHPGYYISYSCCDIGQSGDVKDDFAARAQARLWYTPGRAAGTWLVAGVLNHALFDRRVLQV